MNLAYIILFVLNGLFYNVNAPTTQQMLPDVNLKTLSGQSVNIKEHVQKNEYTILSFWATWCKPCKEELDAIKELYPTWSKDYGVELVAITIDNARGLNKVKPMVKTKGWDYTILSDGKQELQRALNFQTIPQTFIVDSTGKVVYSHNGYNQGDELELEDKIIELTK